MCRTLAPAVAAQSADSPVIAVSVDADPLASGDVHHTPTDPLVRMQVSADAPISLVEVRVDGTTRHTFEPERERFDRSVSLDLETGRYRLTVVARGDGVATHEATVVKDDQAPVMNYSAPFAPEASSDDSDTPPATELTVNRGNVSVAGTSVDAGDEGGGGLRIPVVGVVVPIPDVAGALSTSVSLPIPVGGPIDVPVLAAGAPAVFAVTVAARRRVRGG